MTLMTRDQLLQPAKRRFREVEVNGGTVRIRSITEKERSEWELGGLDRKGKVARNGLLSIKCRLIVLCVVDEDGNPVFRESDVPKLMEQDSVVTDTIATACQEHCGITDSDIEGLEKNSLEGVDSPTD